MDEMKWNFTLGAKGGQDVKENKKDGEITVTDKPAEFGLKIKIKNADNGVDEIIADIVEEVGGLDEATLTFAGTEKQLQEKVKKIAKMIASAGGQQTLDLHLGSEKMAA